MCLYREIKHSVVRLFSFVIKLVVPIKKGRVLCESFGGLQYSCNPKYISEEILRSHSDYFQVIWSFTHPQTSKSVDDGIRIVKKASLKELFYINTSEFLITNIRLNNLSWGWQKRPDQKYIMTWHGSMALKRVEFDASSHLPASYMKKAEKDSQNIDLMLSDSKWCTLFNKTAFHYNGEILEKGLPRNDIFLQPDTIKQTADKVRKFYHINENVKILLYAPTFRVDKNIDNYIFRWDSIVSALKDKFCSDFIVMIRLHPNMINVVDTAPMMTSPYCIDATRYEDMQELLCAADVLITDYSSSMFEFALKKTPCFLYVPDRETYDRGFYFKLEELPFPLSTDTNSLVNQIQVFDENKYLDDVNHLFNETFGSFQRPDSSAEVVKWMLERSQKEK